MSDDEYTKMNGEIVDCVDGSKTVVVDGLFLVPPIIGAKHCVDVHVTPIVDLLKGNIRVLDIGFGAGWTASALLDECDKRNCRAEIVGVEKNVEVYNIRKELVSPFKKCGENNSVKIIIDDAVKKIDTLGMFDIILLDGWNEIKTPELYSEEFLKKCYTILKKGGTITVNTGSWSVKENLVKAGFQAETVKHKYYESLVGRKE